MFNPAWSVRQAAEQLLGSRDLTFGGILPNNCSLLQKHIPPIAGLTDEAVLDGSAFHLIAPLLNDIERQELRSSLFENQRGMRGWMAAHARKGIPLRYCAACARNDKRTGKPLIWRTLHNHPAVVCCDVHGCTLISTAARFNTFEIHDPNRWIDYKTALPGKASKLAIAIASDARWLYEQKSSIIPGYHRITVALRKAVGETKAYRIGYERFCHSRIMGDLQDKFGSLVSQIDPKLISLSSHQLPDVTNRAPLPRYILFSQLVGLSLKDLFERALTESITSCGSMHDTCSKSNLILVAKKHLEALVKRNPLAKRKQIDLMSPWASSLIRRVDPGFYEKIMPVRQRKGRTSYLDWGERDRFLFEQISDISGSLGNNARSCARILHSLKLPQRLFYRAQGRLPHTKA